MCLRCVRAASHDTSEEHLGTIRGIGLDSVTVSTHLLQHLLLLSYVTQKDLRTASRPGAGLYKLRLPDCRVLTGDAETSTLKTHRGTGNHLMRLF